MTSVLYYVFADLGQFEAVNGTIDLTAKRGDSIVIHLPHIESYPPPSSSILWKSGSRSMNKDGVQHHISLNGSLVLLDRPQSASGTQYHVEVVNGIVGLTRSGPEYTETITGKPSGRIGSLTHKISKTLLRILVPLC